jgi:hypothetical protein
MLTAVEGTLRACILRRRMTTSGRQDDVVEPFEPRDVLYFATEYSEAVRQQSFLKTIACATSWARLKTKLLDSRSHVMLLEMSNYLIS